MEAMKIERSAVLNADRDRVWRAITQPEHISKWFGDSIQFGRLAVGETMTFFNGTVPPGKIMRVEPPEWFAFHWSAEVGYNLNNLVTFHLETVPEGTRITVTESGFEALPAELGRKRYDMNNEGWSIQLANITAYLDADSDV
jgi:uncharacterized protein YndB with AHSA1/START domain